METKAEQRYDVELRAALDQSLEQHGTLTKELCRAIRCRALGSALLTAAGTDTRSQSVLRHRRRTDQSLTNLLDTPTVSKPLVIHMPGRQALRLQQYCAQHGLTPDAVVLAALCAMIERFEGAENSVVTANSPNLK